VRIHRPNRTWERLRREHRVIHWAAAQRLPVHPPLRDDRGETLIEVEGRIVALFPWLPGRSLERDAITPEQAAAMGDMHGRLHATLARYDDPELPSFAHVMPSENPGADLRDCRARLGEVDLTATERTIIVEYLDRHLALLEAERGRPPLQPTLVGAQPIHGDYHERNILVDEAGRITAVVDWDMVRTLPRALEVARTITFSLFLGETPLVEPYLAAYGEHVTLAPEECEEAVALWWEYVLRDTWLARTRIIDRDPLVQPFFAESIEHHFRYLADPAFRVWLAGEFGRWAGPRR